jgi:hypothetical protein
MKSAPICAIALAIGLAAPASAGCKKSITLREVPGGEPQRAQLIECDESETPTLLEGNAHLTLCDPAALSRTGASFEGCARAVDAAREGLRKAKIRAALRAGTEKELIADRYAASSEEIEALRTSADLSGPIPAEESSSEETAQ